MTARPEDTREHHVGMAVHSLMSAADDVRSLSDEEIRDSATDLRLTVAVLLARLRMATTHPLLDTS